MEAAAADPTVFRAASLPRDPRLWPPLTNAYLGTRVFQNRLHVSGLYNGAAGDTHRAALPSPLNVRLEAPAGAREPLTSSFALDTNTGSFLHTMEGSSFRASQCLYAHRTLPHVLAFCVSITRLDTGREPISVWLRSAFSPESPDLELHLGPDFQGARSLGGWTLTPEQPGGPRQEVHMLWTPAPPVLTLEPAASAAAWDFLVVVAGSREQAQARLLEALELQAAGRLYRAHTQAWAQLWEGCGLAVGGPLPLRQALRGALFYLLSGLSPPGSPGDICHGLSPGGLSNGRRGECYWGHVFWDQDLWIFPNVLLLHPEAARALLQYRIRTLRGALQNARDLGCQGAKFAWESAGSGLEVCPEAVYGTQELHINGAVLLAFQLYYHATQDLALFREAGGWDVVRAVAEFWCSRVEWSPEDGQYHLRGVMPPDEYHSGVDNSVYTNVQVQNSLRFAAALAQDLGQPIPPQWLAVADQIKVPFDPERNFHPEFDGYEPGEEVKQADVVLLGYPVPFSLSPQVRRTNLEVYEAVTDPRGPAMTWSMFAVGWLELKEPGRARTVLDRCFSHISEPFKVWTENGDGSGAVNFLTGMGGFLQTALFGFTGFRITAAGVTFDPECPAGVSGLRVTGVSFLGSKLDFSFCEGSVSIGVSAAGPQAPPLEVQLWPSQTRLPLPPGHSVSFPRSAGCIQQRLP
ncbi:protein-glucosylgalactosylhydroxylysine glucosidase isoform X3 [Erinaceus europaeus]|uniref:Protein-glucosylgalactosylhydroxylysine glucosidase isoform X3 n=1 Tax=Erinaceus europaeus TaxID=9365 RepID=A0A1S3AKL8_ERIEU|nr:protein-glucosylgalactosylhydroxylysine glucosidase isoform X3 [Erinaceus europaeus]